MNLSRDILRTYLSLNAAKQFPVVMQTTDPIGEVKRKTEVVYGVPIQHQQINKLRYAEKCSHGEETLRGADGPMGSTIVRYDWSAPAR